MGLFKSLFTQVNTQHKATSIGGVPFSVLDRIKENYNPNNRYTAKLDLYRIHKDEVLELLKKGFNPNYLNRFDNPYFLVSENVDVLKILEYFGADIHFENGFPKKMRAIYWGDVSLVDEYKDTIKDFNHSYLCMTTDVNILRKYKEYGVRFNPQRETYDYKNNLSLWYCIRTDNDKRYSDAANYILNETDFDLMKEVTIDEIHSKKTIFLWFKYFQSIFPSYIKDEEKKPEEYRKFFNTFSQYIKYDRKTSTGLTLFDFYEISSIPSSYKESVLNIFKEFGLDYEVYLNDIARERKLKSGNTSNAVHVKKEEARLSQEELELQDLEIDKDIVIKQEQIDEIKKTYKINRKYTSYTFQWSGKAFDTLPRNRIVEVLKEGLDPNQFIASDNKIGYAPFFCAMHIEDLKILEQFGADIHLTGSKKDKLKYIARLNFALYDFYEDFLLSSDVYRLTEISSLRKLQWFHEHKYDFQLKDVYRKINDVPYWRVLVNYDATRDDFHTTNEKEFLLNTIKIDLNKQITIEGDKTKNVYIYWWILFYFYLEYQNRFSSAVKESINNLTKILDKYAYLIDINSTNPNGDNFAIMVDFLKEDLKDEFLNMLKNKGMDLRGRDIDQTKLIIDKKELDEISNAKLIEKFKGQDLIGGYRREELDYLRDLPKNESYTYYDVNITQKNVLEEIKKGFDPKVKYVGNAVMLKAPDQDVLEIFEYLGGNIDHSLIEIHDANSEYTSQFIYETYIDEIIKNKPRIFEDIFEVSRLELLNSKGFNFNATHDGAAAGWGCLLTILDRYRDARNYLLENTNLDLSLPINNSQIKTLNSKMFPSWYLYAFKNLGGVYTLSKDEFAKKRLLFEEILVKSRVQIEISQTTEDSLSVYWCFLKSNQTSVIKVLDYFMNNFGLNPYYKNNKGISFIEQYDLNKQSHSKVLEYLNEFKNLDKFKTCDELIVEEYKKFEYKKESKKLTSLESFADPKDLRIEIENHTLDILKVVKDNVGNINVNSILEIFSEFSIFDDLDLEDDIKALTDLDQNKKIESLNSILNDVFSVLDFEDRNRFTFDIIFLLKYGYLKTEGKHVEGKETDHNKSDVTKENESIDGIESLKNSSDRFDRLEKDETRVLSIEITDIEDILNKILSNEPYTIPRDTLNNEYILNPIGRDLGWFHLMSVYLKNMELDNQNFDELISLLKTLSSSTKSMKNSRHENIFFTLRHLRRQATFSDFLNQKTNPKFPKLLAKVIKVFMDLGFNPLDRNLFNFSYYDLLKSDEKENRTAISIIEKSSFYMQDERYNKNVIYPVPNDQMGEIEQDLIELIDSDEDAAIEFIESNRTYRYAFTNPLNLSILDICIFFQKTNAAKALIDLGHDLNHFSISPESHLLEMIENGVEDLSNKNALMLAISNKDTFMVNYLLQNKADARLIDKSSLETPMFTAILAHNFDLINLLRKHEATLKFNELRVNMGEVNVFFPCLQHGIAQGNIEFADLFPYIEENISRENLIDSAGNHIYIYIQDHLINKVIDIFKEHNIEYDRSFLNKLNVFLGGAIQSYFMGKEYLLSMEQPDETLVNEYLDLLTKGEYQKAEQLVNKNSINLNYSSENIVHKLLEYLETDKTISLDVFKKSVQSFKNMGFFIDGRQNGNTPLLANLFKTSFCTDSEEMSLYIEVANTMIEFGSNINAIGNLDMSVYDFIAKIKDSEDATLLLDKLVRKGAKSARIQYEEVGLIRYDITKYGW